MDPQTNTAGVPEDQHLTNNGKKYFIFSPGKTFKPKEDIIRKVLEHTSGRKVATVDECDAILVFCFIVSRAGTDIDAALNELNAHSETKPAVFIVLHYTFDPEKTVPDSSRYVRREETLTVDCLFNDEGFLKCVRNDEAQTRIRKWLQLQSSETWDLIQEKEISTFNGSDLIIASELKLVLLGMHAWEKTAVEHMILGKRESLCNTSTAPLMKMTVDTEEVDGDQIAVINTPNSWFSSELSREKIKQKIPLFIGLFSDGPCVSLLVIPVKQFKQDKERLKNFENPFFKRNMNLFIATNEQEEQEIQKHDLKVYEPFHVLNISQPENRSQVSKLLEEIKTIVKGKDSYVSEMSATEIEEAIVKSKRVSIEEVNYRPIKRQKRQHTVWIALKHSDPNEPFVFVERRV